MKKIKIFISAIVGNMIEYYDITLYGFFSAFLAPKFFPSDDYTVASLMSLGTFAMGFLMRPFGGIFFGHIGDKYGRKKALVLSVLLVSIPTTLIGCLPYYNQIGILAPLIILLCRMFQGFCTGGEYAGASIFLWEHASPKHKNFICSILPSFSHLGAILGALLGAICTISPMPEWAWRVPFLLGGVFGIIGFLARSLVSETPEFQKNVQKNQLKKFPLKTVLLRGRLQLFEGMCVGAATLIPFYTIMIYMNAFMKKHVDISTSGSMFLSSGLMLLGAILFPIFGKVSDLYGKSTIMAASSFLLIIFAFPLFYFAKTTDSLPLLILTQCLIAAIAAGYVAPSGAFMAEAFPSSTRYTGIAVGVSLGEVICGGTSPLICMYLVQYTGSSLSPALWLMFGGILGLISIKIHGNYKRQTYINELYT
jgi:MHS family proline/betaine transporter-like MFS transporter